MQPAHVADTLAHLLPQSMAHSRGDGFHHEGPVTLSEERDAKLFSRAAGRLFLRTFQTVRKGLIEGGVKEAAHVAWIEETEEWPPE